MNNCKECEFCDKKLKTKVRLDYIYCNRLRFWRSYKYLCALMRQSKYVTCSEEELWHNVKDE